MEAQILSFLLFIVPSFMLFYFMTEVYMRSRMDALHRLAAVIMADLIIWFLGEYARGTLPIRYAYWIETAWINLAIVLAMGLCMHFYLRLTHTAERWKPFWFYGICYAPGAVIYFMIVNQHWFYVDSVPSGMWKSAVPGPGYPFLIIYGFLYTFFPMYLTWKAARSADRLREKRKLRILFYGTVLAISWVGIFGVLEAQFAVWPFLGVYGCAFWAVSLRIAMTKYNFLPLNAKRYHTLFEMSPYGILLLDEQGTVMEANDNACKLLGAAPGELKDRSIVSLCPEAKREETRQFVQAVREGRGKTKWRNYDWTFPGMEDENVHLLLDSKAAEISGEIMQFVILRDVTSMRLTLKALQASEERMTYLAYHDALTRLPNRLSFQLRLSEAMKMAGKEGMLAVMLLDLDRFKIINDSLGHQAGDKVLQNASERLLRQIKPTDTLARLGGDEFIALLPSIADANEAMETAERMLEALMPPFTIEGTNYFITGSIGISLYPLDGEDGDSLMKRADIAMYRAKEQGRNTSRIYNASMHGHISEKLKLDQQLRQALERQEFIVHYQPQVEIGSGKVYGMEALLRWQSPEGMIPPDQFIPYAEESGLIIPIGYWVLEQVCKQQQQWQESGYAPLIVSVNISASQFIQADFVEHISGMLQATGLDPRFLCLELTESTTIKNVPYTITVLQELIDIGIAVSIDDFGKGYSSLDILRRLPLHSIKIDRDFIRDIHSGAGDYAVVNAMIALSRSLKLNVVAEGVESEEQFNYLQKQGCNAIQGFYISRPVSEDLFADRFLRPLQSH